MAYSIFLDTNILVDFFLPKREKHIDAVKLVDCAQNNLLKIYFSESVINTTAYLIRKSIYLDGFKKAIQELITFIKVLPCSNLIVEEAYKNAKNDLEDAVLYQIALNGKMDYFITSDSKDFKKLAHPSLPVVSAKKMLEILKS